MSRKIRIRSLLIGGMFTLLFVGLLGRIYWVQIVEADGLLAKAETMWKTGKVLEPKRGTIYDRNRKVLAEEAQAFTVAVLPQVTNANGVVGKVAEGLAAILSGTADPAVRSKLQDKITDQITKKRQDGVSLYAEVEIRNEGWKIDKSTADQITELIRKLKDEDGKDPGIILKDEVNRSYPGGRLASHLLGYTDKEGAAVIGLEAFYDAQLRGEAGSITYGKDRKGVELINSRVNYEPAMDGNDLHLTLDMNIQFFMENVLRKVYEEYRPNSLIAIAADPKTMEILGMVSLPDFNPNQYWQTSNQSDFINRAVAYQFEPGSTFKLVTLAGSVEEGLFREDDKYKSGSIRVTGATLHDWSSNWGEMTYLEGLKRSSNVAFVKLGVEMLGESKLMEYIRSFGFGSRTGIDIAGEVSGMVRMQRPVEYATATYGQGLTATALQLTAAYAAVANGGYLMKPYVVKEVSDSHTGEVLQSYGPQQLSQVISERTAADVASLLEQTVTDQNIGTGRNAYMEEYRVAGKTGTAQVVVSGEKGYSKDQWVISFSGFAPVEDPKILLTIIAERPDLQGNFQQGGMVTLPAFKEIIRESLRYMGVPSSRQPTNQVSLLEIKNVVPDLEGISTVTAQRRVSQAGMEYITLGGGSRVIRQFPTAGTEIGGAQQIYLLTQESFHNQVPDMIGRSLREALEICSLLDLQCHTNGEGYVTEQTMDSTPEGNLVQLRLEPLRSAAGLPEDSDTSKE